MFVIARWLLFASLTLAVTSFASAGERLICCGGPEVFILPAEGERATVKERLWRWQAKDSPEIPEHVRDQFRTTDECKPYEETILITSSSGGVALVRREDKRALFFTSAKNAHSACLLPNHRVAVAASTGGDALLVYSLEHSGEKATPLASLELVGAHGAEWDAERKRLWALGTHELLLVEIRDRDDRTELAVTDRWKLPTPGGHDLSPARDGRHLYVTVNEAVYRFDKQEQRFAPLEPLATARAVKSLDEHPTSGKIVYHQADHENKVWWSDRIRFLDPPRILLLPDERLYKVRWDVARKP